MVEKRQQLGKLSRHFFWSIYVLIINGFAHERLFWRQFVDRFNTKKS
jgi:hypothetical protein